MRSTYEFDRLEKTIVSLDQGDPILDDTDLAELHKALYLLRAVLLDLNFPPYSIITRDVMHKYDEADRMLTARKWRKDREKRGVECDENNRTEDD